MDLSIPEFLNARKIAISPPYYAYCGFARASSKTALLRAIAGRLIVARVARYRMMRYFLALCSTIGQVLSSRLRRPIETARMNRQIEIAYYSILLASYKDGGLVDSYETVATPIR